MNRAALTLFAVLAVACSKPTKVDGTVTDVWGTPISGATVQLEGVVEPASTDNGGAFVFEVKKGQQTFRVQAGKEGYVPGIAKVELAKEGEKGDVPKVHLKLYPTPKQPGFYAVNKQGMDHLPAATVRTVGTDVRARTGLPDEGDVHMVAQKAPEFLFQSTLKSSELAKLDLQLHRLEYVKSDEVSGVLGDVEAQVNLWVAKERVEFDLEGLPRDNTYLIRLRNMPPKGTYAFSTQGVLVSQDPAALDKLPKELQIAYPFSLN